MDATMEDYIFENAPSTTLDQGLLDGILPSAGIIQAFMIISTIIGLLLTVALIVYAVRALAVQKATLRMQQDIAAIKDILTEKRETPQVESSRSERPDDSIIARNE